MLIETYPDGYGDEDIVAFKNHNGEFIEAVELRTDEALYLVKISQSLSHFIANFDDSIVNELEEDVKAESEESALELNLEEEFEGENDLD